MLAQTYVRTFSLVLPFCMAVGALLWVLTWDTYRPAVLVSGLLLLNLWLDGRLAGIITASTTMSAFFALLGYFKARNLGGDPVLVTLGVGSLGGLGTLIILLAASSATRARAAVIRT